MKLISIKKKLVVLAFAFMAVVTSMPSYADLTSGATITRIGGDIRNNDLFAIQLSKDIVNGLCARNNVLYLDPSDSAQKALIAVAITAQVTGQSVTLIDSGTCTETFNGSTVGNVALIFADA